MTILFTNVFLILFVFHVETLENSRGDKKKYFLYNLFLKKFNVVSLKFQRLYLENRKM